jgi:hypothetical protein
MPQPTNRPIYSQQMATTTDTHRAAIRERKRQAHQALHERHRRQESAQTATFSALDRLAKELDRARDELGDDVADPLERAAYIAATAAQLQAAVDDVRAAANDLVDIAGITQSEVAELLGTRPALLFPRVQSARRQARSSVSHPEQPEASIGCAVAPPR